MEQNLENKDAPALRRLALSGLHLESPGLFFTPVAS
jgi:hypothetical protein